MRMSPKACISLLEGLAQTYPLAKLAKSQPQIPATIFEKPSFRNFLTSAESAWNLFLHITDLSSKPRFNPHDPCGFACSLFRDKKVSRGDWIKPLGNMRSELVEALHTDLLKAARSLDDFIRDPQVLAAGYSFEYLDAHEWINHTYLIGGVTTFQNGASFHS